ncbi:cation diffusion facilitator family transporter [Tropicimonas sp. IMCC6043]|uniref:cation diffusion facilitator family transporter n=1 Tax=Tropicimonas sp. IMCC6043 TaxID=2510645 RepID=UPI00101CEF9E|nr:cation diffusion facilitator family transporter [Tropicimonas sp. IMCC6043]RYH09786.1 cation transporter [Tropicimonas sp. IMCC6043]
MPTRSRTDLFALGSIAVAFAVLALKSVAWWLTGSPALLSDALESLVNVAGALMAWTAIRIASRPADANHPFGHHKAENFSAIVEGSLIIVAALLIVQSAWHSILEPGRVELGLPGLAINALAGAINLAWARILIREGRRARSPALGASGRHLMSDVWTSVGVLAGLLVVMATGWALLDPILAILVAANILREGWQVIFSSAGDLMDSAAQPEDRDIIETVVRDASRGALQVHDIRTRRAGQMLFVEFHLVVDREMSVGDAHAICDTIEAAVTARLPGSRTTIHVEPDEKLKATGLLPAGAPDPDVSEL